MTVTSGLSDNCKRPTLGIIFWWILQPGFQLFYRHRFGIRVTALFQASAGMETRSGVHAFWSPGVRSGLACRTGMRSSLRLPSSLAIMASMSA
jgi:hypothetical protein